METHASISASRLTYENALADREETLWRAVVGQAIHDVYAGTWKERASVLNWTNTEWFEVICGMADIHSESMREQIVALFRLPHPLRVKYGPMLRQKIIGDDA